MRSVQGISPEELLERIKTKRIKVHPVIKIETPLGPQVVFCDCSGCNNNAIVTDIHLRPDDDITKTHRGKIKGFFVLEDE